MKVEYARLAFIAIDVAKRRDIDRVGQEAKITAAAARPVARSKPDRGHGNLHKLLAGEWVKSKARRVRYPVIVMDNRIDAGAVAVTCKPDLVQGPQVVLRYGETRRAITFHLAA